jgi:hypothetical protein
MSFIGWTLIQYNYSLNKGRNLPNSKKAMCTWRHDRQWKTWKTMREAQTFPSQPSEVANPAETLILHLRHFVKAALANQCTIKILFHEWQLRYNSDSYHSARPPPGQSGFLFYHQPVVLFMTWGVLHMVCHIYSFSPLMLSLNKAVQKGSLSEG